MTPTRRLSTDRTRPRLRLVVVLLAIIAAGAVGWWLLRSGEPPTVELDSEWPAIGPRQDVEARLSVPDGGLGSARLELVAGDRTEVLDRVDPPTPGVFGLASEAVNAATLHAEIGTEVQPWIGEGEAVLRVVAIPWSGPLRSPKAVVISKPMSVRRSPPELRVLRRTTVVRQGGSGAAVLEIGAHHTSSGVVTAEHEFESVPDVTGGSRHRAVLFAIPREATDASSIRAFAVDDAGLRSEVALPRTLLERPGRRDRIRLDDAFLERVVPAIEARTPSLDASGTLLERYLVINGELRERDSSRLEELAESSSHLLMVDGPFEQLPGSAVLARFGDERDYVYDGRIVDHQVHLGMDLASTAEAPVPAANSGVVVFADWLDIYGNAVVVDHGLGLMSLYGHLSRVSVAPGDRVSTGDVLGNTGQTGLAGGDHLHFEILVDGQAVDPLEWLDGGWVRRSILEPLAGSQR